MPKVKAAQQSSVRIEYGFKLSLKLQKAFEERGIGGGSAGGILSTEEQAPDVDDDNAAAAATDDVIPTIDEISWGIAELAILNEPTLISRYHPSVL